MTEKSNIEQEIAVLTSKRDELKRELEDYKNEINVLIEGKPTLKEQIDERLNRMNSAIELISQNVDKINAFHDEICRPQDGEDKSRLDIFNETYSSINKARSQAEADTKAIEGYKVELLGDPEKNIVGQKERLDKLEGDIKTRKDTWEYRMETLFTKIEGLLPGATSTGLAKAYQDQRKSYTIPYWFWAFVFVLTICGTIWFAVEHLKDATSLEDAFMRVISRLPFFVPAFWLAIFASKQQSQNKRLQQEYAYKEALTKSYEADKREIEKLPDSDEKTRLSTKLLETMIDAAKYNPSETLGSNVHNDSPPSVFELFKMKLLEKITRTDKTN